MSQSAFIAKPSRRQASEERLNTAQKLESFSKPDHDNESSDSNYTAEFVAKQDDSDDESVSDLEPENNDSGSNEINEVEEKKETSIQSNEE